MTTASRMFTTRESTNKIINNVLLHVSSSSTSMSFAGHMEMDATCDT